MDATRETGNAIRDHFQQVGIKAKKVKHYVVRMIPQEQVEARAIGDLIASMDRSTEALNRLRIEGNLTS